MAENLKYTEHGSKAELSLSGSWRINRLAALTNDISQLELGKVQEVEVDGSSLTKIDTAGAMALLSGLKGKKVQLKNFDKDQLSLIQLVEDRLDEPVPRKKSKELGLIDRIGRGSIHAWDKARELLSFVGQCFSYFWRAVKNPKLFRGKEIVGQLELVLVDAIPVVILVTFLIGVVLAYLFASQIQQYGANIFIVDSVGLSICRELAPILVAIVMAGRSGSAFTAQIGTMKLNEEVDALSTLGLSPMHALVLPRILALVIAMPLLVILGDLVGVAGGMMVADFQLGISSTTFLDRLQIVLPWQSFAIGLIKAPIFAVFIGIIGCRMGLVVENSARSVGINTTSTVVQSIVSVILINAAFAVLYVQLGY